MTVGVCGYGYTGSGAVIDLLKEYEECSVCDDFEFCFTYIPYGLEDLKYHLIDHPQRYNSSEAAIKDFKRWVQAQNTIRNPINRGTSYQLVSLSNKFINSLNPIEWVGYSSFDYVHYGLLKKKFLFRIMTRVNKAISRILNYNNDLFPNNIMQIAYPDEKLYMDSAKKYISKLIESTNIDSNLITVLNQPFEANAPEQSFDYFDNPKAIVVDKDPRDLYLLIKEIIKEDGKFIPSHNAHCFASYYKATHEMIKSDKTDAVLRIKFEDLVYRYEQTKAKIESFIGIKKHKDKNKFFNPDVSICNTQLFKRYPQYKEDIKFIENELSDFIYPFNENIKVNLNGKSF